jgi:nitrogen fixation/metabolism regulation signal transduction histidine kinase
VKRSAGWLILALRSSLAERWVWIISATAMLSVALVLSFLLSEATNNRQFYAQHYQWLFWVNMGVAGLLVLVILLALGRLMVRLTRGKFGSRLLLKLAGIFALVGLLPGLVIYTVSYQFVSRSIESWFDVEVEGALEAGLALGRGTLDTLQNDLLNQTRLAAERLADSPDLQQLIPLERLREQLSAQDVALLNLNGRTVMHAGVNLNESDFSLSRATAAQLRQAKARQAVAFLEGLEEEGSTLQHQPRIRAIAWMPSTKISLDFEDRFLVITQFVPNSLAQNALSVQSAYREYQQRALARQSLKQLYISTLTLTLIMAVFGALLLAATLGQQLARPLVLLAQGVREVARGDLGPKPVFASRDELGGLTRSFANMTQQLADARQLAQRSLSELDAARAGVQTILDNLTTGVLVFGKDGKVTMANPAAAAILSVPFVHLEGLSLESLPGPPTWAQGVRARFDALMADPDDRDHWQETVELRLRAGDDPLTLLVRGAMMPQRELLLVFDDITELVSAQRAEAWGEVARRLAHEIKNPLTPIQLSAERLQHKLESKLGETERLLLVKSVDTIVTQVQAMKQLVNEFRDYARLPAAQLVAVDINAMVAEVLVLYGNAVETGHLKAELASSLPQVMGDITQLRQVIHNLVQNALEAVGERQEGLVRISTDVLLSESSTVLGVRLRVTDNGPGFPEKVLKRAFEPYITTKAKGTGLGLAVVKKIADEHAARVRLGNWGEGGLLETGTTQSICGAQVSLSFSKLASVKEV